MVVRHMRQQHERRERDAAPEPVDAKRAVPLPADLALASALGNRALAGVIAGRTLSRDDAPTPAATDTASEPGKEALSAEDKTRARVMIIGPLRAAAEQLHAGPKANMGSIVRHLEPVEMAVFGIKWPLDMQAGAFEPMQDLSSYVEMLRDLKLSDRQRITKIRTHWSTARKYLQAATQAIYKLNVPDKKHPERVPSDRAAPDMGTVQSLEGQLDATANDLAEAPRTKEGYEAVELTASGILEMFDSIEVKEVSDMVVQARHEFMSGMTELEVLADGKEEAIKDAAMQISLIADEYTVFLGDHPAEPPKADDEADPSADPTPPAPSAGAAVEPPKPAAPHTPEPAGAH
jgi:hypothetical protein